MTDERIKIYIWPFFPGEDKGEGGVRRVVEGMRHHLPAFGVDVVDTAEEADLLAAHITAPPDFYTRYADKPLVAHNHGLYWEEYEWGNWGAKDNADVLRLILAADSVTAPTEWVAQAIRRQTSREVLVVPHGVETYNPFDGPHGGYALWNKTRVDSICDPRPVLEAARRLPSIPFHSTFLPEGETSANVQLLGRQPWSEAMREVAQAGVYLATARETFGIGTIEAMAAGVPIVGFRHGGNPEYLTHLQDSYLAEVGDYNDLARGIVWALQHRETVGAWARLRAQDFTWERACEDYAFIYRRAVEDRRAAVPRVSIVVPAYGLAAFLPDALRSVQTQTAGDWECIVVDDASPDECGAIAEEFAAADRRFRVVHNDTNQYLAEARNIGIAAAEGRYILPLDADDMLAPNAVEILAAALDSRRDLHVAYGGVRFVDQDGRTPTVYRGFENAPGSSGWPQPFNQELLLARAGQPLPYASMFRRDAWLQTGGYRTRVRSSEDCDFWMRLARHGYRMTMVTTNPTLIYRNRPDSMSRVAGWHDAENKQWFPEVQDRRLLPAPAREITTFPLWDPIVTVVIACGPGHEGLVQTAMDSVAAQTEPRWHCIVVDDTGGEAACRMQPWVEYMDARDAYLPEREYDQPAGVVRARNLGLAAATTRYVLFLDADDYLQPEALALHLLAAAGEDVVVYSDFWSEYQDGRFVREETPDYDPRFVLRQSLHAVTALYPRAALDAVRGFSFNRPWEDWDLQLKLGEAGTCSRRLAHPTWVYRKDTGTRREDRYARREDGKNDMLLVWGDYMEGRKTMACAACGTGRPVFAPGAPSRNLQFNSKPENMADAILLDYIGDGEGKQTLRGSVTGTPYLFQKGRPKYVDPRDAERFLSRGTHRRVEAQAGAPTAPAEVPAAPVLTAPGAPSQRVVAVATPAAPAPFPFGAMAIDTSALPPELAPTVIPGSKAPPPFTPPPLEGEPFDAFNLGGGVPAPSAPPAIPFRLEAVPEAASFALPPPPPPPPLLTPSQIEAAAEGLPDASRGDSATDVQDVPDAADDFTRVRLGPDGSEPDVDQPAATTQAPPRPPRALPRPPANPPADKPKSHHAKK